MLHSLWTIIVVAIGLLSFSRLINTWERGAKKPSPQSLSLTNQQFSFLSLVVFLFFPTAKTSHRLGQPQKRVQHFRT